MPVPAKTDDRQQQQETPMAAFRRQLEGRLDSFIDALPPHITVQRFKSIVSWAVVADPGLLAADRVSLFEACLAAANDGLVPDKKEGALVIYKTKIKEGSKEIWIKKVQWMPMVRGIITKLYNTGQVKSVSLDLVYGGDEFRYWKDDGGEHLEHYPAENRDKSIMRRVYALVVMKDGAVFAEPLDMDEVEKIRAKSKSRDDKGNPTGPWRDWYEEMAKKAAIRRLAKRLPVAREIQQVLDRDNYLHDFDGEQAQQQITRGPRPSIAQRLDHLSEGVAMDLGADVANKEPASSSSPPHPRDDAEKRANPPRGRAEEPDDATDSSSGSDGDDEDDAGDAVASSRTEGAKAKAKGQTKKSMPPEYRQNETLGAAWTEGFENAEAE